MRDCTPSLAVFSGNSTGFKYGEFGGHSSDGIYSRFYFSNISTVAHVWWILQVLQGSVEILFKWRGKRLIYINLTANLFRKPWQISSELSEFCRCYKSILTFCLNTVYNWMFYQEYLLRELRVRLHVSHSQCVRYCKFSVETLSAAALLRWSLRHKNSNVVCYRLF